MNDLRHSGAGDHSALVEIDGFVIGNEIWMAREEIRASYLLQTPGRHPTDLWIGIGQSGDHGGSDVLEVVTGKRAEPPDGSENSSAEALEVFLFEVDEEGCEEGYIIGVQSRQTPQNFGHGLRSAPTDSAGLVVDEPHEATQEFANVVGIVFRDAGGGNSYGLDGAVADPGIRSVGQCDEISESALPSCRHFGDFAESPLIEELE